MRFAAATLLLALAGCASLRAQGTWAADTHAGTLVTAAFIAVGMAIEGDEQSRVLCDDNDPPHTCPGTTPGPLSPPPPPPEE